MHSYEWKFEFLVAKSMITHFLLGLLCVFLAAVGGWSKSHKVTIGLLGFVFFLIFAFSALRYDFGNDYLSYIDIFNDSKYLDTSDFSKYDGHSELGWVLLCWLFQPLGFFWMVAVLALFNSIVYYRFLVKYCPKEYYWLAVFIYIFSTNNMLVQLSAMRQAVAVSIFIISIDFLLKKQVLKYLVLIYFATWFHSSVIIVSLLIFLPFLQLKNNKYSLFLVISLYFSSYFIAQDVSLMLNNYIVPFLGQYDVYQDAGVVSSGLGLITLSMIFLFMMFSTLSLSKKDMLIVKIGAISFMIIPFSLLVMMIARISMYFQAALIVAIPLAVMSVKNKLIRALFLIPFIIFTLYGYFTFFASPIYHQKFNIYHTVFSDVVANF